jgi:predicted 3-demethylubiquinone-9 3-methyltransferase (glyoxalase superfamily)
MQKIHTFLWFDDQAEEAANFYVSVFKNSKILQITHYAEGTQKPAGSVMTVTFSLDGQEFIALNGGPQFKFTEAISLVVNCDTQIEIDIVWEKLTANGGEEVECGWVKDRYGLSWQIVPSILFQLLEGDSQERANRVMQAVWQMKKLDIETLKRAAETPASEFLKEEAYSLY